MAQVSESTTSLQEAARALQSQSPRQNQPVSPDRGETAENGRSDRLAQTEENNSASQVRQAEDRVVISREAVTENRATRTSEGARNVDNLKPPSEQRANERGAAQKLNDQAEVAAPGTQITEAGLNRTQPANTPEINAREVSDPGNRSQSREAADTRDQIRSEVGNNQNTETPLREFQNQLGGETLIEPRRLSKSAEEIEGPRERADAAKETVFEIPSQRIIEKVEPGETAQAKFANNPSENDQAESNRQPPSPSSVQTETGQNVDDLI